jgi:hypothetical protein
MQKRKSRYDDCSLGKRKEIAIAHDQMHSGGDGWILIRDIGNALGSAGALRY